MKVRQGSQLNSVEHSPFSEANNHSATQEIPHLLWNPKFQYCVHRRLPQVLNINHMYLVHTFTIHFPKIHFNNVLPLTPTLSEWSLPFRFTDKKSHACYIPAHLIDVSYSEDCYRDYISGCLSLICHGLINQFI